MINAKGETIYTSAEIAYELGISPGTVNAIGRRLFGHGRIPHWTNDVKLITEYLKSITVEEDAKRLAILHDTISGIMAGVQLQDDSETRKRVDKDIHLKTE